MGNIVGALAVELGLNTAEFEKGLRSLPGLAQKHLGSMSAEMKRTTREGAESMRLIDEAFGIHISRPIARILSQEFPQFAKGLQSLLGVGVALGIGAAAFDFIAKGIERVSKALEDAKKKQEEWIESSHKLETMLFEGTNSFEQQMDRIKARLSELSGDKGTALAANLRILTRDDAAEAVKAIDDITDAFLRNAKAAEEAQSLWNRFKLGAANNVFGDRFTIETEEIRKSTEEIKRNFDTLVLSDPLHGLEKGAGFLKEEITKAKVEQQELLHNQVSGVDALLARLTFLDSFTKKYSITTKAMVEENQAKINALEADLKRIQQLTQIDTGKKSVATRESETTRDIGEKELTKLRSETEAQLALAASTSKTTAEQKLQQAAGEADQIIARIQEQAHGRLTRAIKEELLAVHALTAERLVAKDAVQTNDELQKQVETVQRQISAERELAAAYVQGGVAIENAKIDQRLGAQVQAVQKLRDEYTLLKKAADDYAASATTLGSAAGPKPGLDISSENISKVKTSLEAAESKLAQLRLESLIEDEAKYQTEINQTSRTLADEQPYLDRINEAYSQNAEAVRRARVDLALYHWEQAHPGPSVAEAQATLANPAASEQERQAAQTRLDQIQQVNVQLEQQSIIQQRQADAQLAARYNIIKSYDDEIARLERAREVLQQYGADTLAIDAAIFDERQKQLKQWDDAALKVGSFRDKYQAVMNELVIEGQDAGAKIADAFLGSIRSSEDELAKFLTGQKVQPQKIIQGLAEQVTKAEIQHTVGEIAGHLGLTLPGTESKIGTAASNPMYVAVVNQQPGVRTELNQLTLAGSRTEFAPAINLAAGPLADLEALTSAQIRGTTIGASPEAPSAAVGKPDGSTSKPYHVVSATPSVVAPATAAQGNYIAPPAVPAPVGSSLAASGLSLLLSGFAGFRAGGGHTESGKSYVVGENGPELFRSSTSGAIIPNSALPSSLGPPSLIPGGNANWTFDPHASYAQPYEAYERWLHRGQGDSGLFSSLGLLGGLLFKTGLFDRIFHHATSPGALASTLPARIQRRADLDALTASVTSSGGLGVAISPKQQMRNDLDALTASSASSAPSAPSASSLITGLPSPTTALPSPAAQVPPSFVNLPKFSSTSDFAVNLDGFRATGGPVGLGNTYMVGERGPELFRPSADGHIIPNHMLHLLNPSAPAMPTGVSDFAGFMADGGDVFAGRSYVVGERGREAYNFPAVSEVSSSDNRDYSQRGGDTYNIHQHINENSRDLFNRTSSQLLNALKKR